MKSLAGLILRFKHLGPVIASIVMKILLSILKVPFVGKNHVITSLNFVKSAQYLPSKFSILLTMFKVAALGSGIKVIKLVNDDAVVVLVLLLLHNQNLKTENRNEDYYCD